jgi:hypothetical protein
LIDVEEPRSANRHLWRKGELLPPKARVNPVCVEEEFESDLKIQGLARLVSIVRAIRVAAREVRPRRHCFGDVRNSLSGRRGRRNQSDLGKASVSDLAGRRCNDCLRQLQENRFTPRRRFKSCARSRPNQSCTSSPRIKRTGIGCADAQQSIPTFADGGHLKSDQGVGDYSAWKSRKFAIRTR